VNKPKCFMELCAGTAALSVRLVGGKDAKPPVSRMGAKTGYADVILSVLGLYPGLGADSFVWCEPDDGVRGLLMAYCQPSVLKEAAAILRSWKDEEPRALWERLRAELKAGAAVDGAEGVARLFTTMSWAYRRGEPDSGYNPGVVEGWERTATTSGGEPLTVHDLAQRLVKVPPLPPTFIARDGRAVTPEEVAKWAYVATRTMPQANARGATAGDFLPRVAPSGVTRYQPDAPAGGFECMPPFPPVTIVADGRAVTPEEVAALILTGVQSYKQMMPESGFLAPGGRFQDTSAEAVAEDIARMAAAEWPPVTITADARTLAPPRLPEGVIVYMDPPYLDTTGYKHDLPRSEVVRMARTWAAAGATVCISEAEPIPELMADGWHAVEISATRRGAKRTFSKQQAEWLTLSRPPSFVPRVTLDLFGGDR